MVIVLPLGVGVVTGALGVNVLQASSSRRRLIEIGLIVLGVSLALISIAGPIAQLLRDVNDRVPGPDISAFVSVLTVVVAIAFVAGIAYAAIAIPAQTELQSRSSRAVRGRVFGILNMLVSVGSFLPIIIVGPISDTIGTMPVVFVAAGILLSGILSIVRRGPLAPAETRATAGMMVPGTAVDPIGIAMRTDDDQHRPMPDDPEAFGE